MKWSKQGFQMTCPLTEGVIDSDLCIEVVKNANIIYESFESSGKRRKRLCQVKR